MMGVHQSQSELFTYSVQLDKRIRPDHPLRQVAAAIDFTFIRAETARFYGQNGNVSVDPAVILKLMFLLFYDNVASERELMGIVAERLDYLWFLGYGLDDSIPDHSVLSKARSRWGKEVFESFFVRVVRQCVERGLVDGGKIHLDSSLIDGNASKDSVVRGPTELIAALKAAYQAQESKLSGTTTPSDYEAVNDRMVSTTDPDAAIVRKGPDSARPRYHHHRAIDDAHGVITAVDTTPGSINEASKLSDLIEGHQSRTDLAPHTVVGDHKYGTANNFIACQQRGLRTHLGDVQAKLKPARAEGIFSESAFIYQPQSNTYLCPAGQIMKLRTFHRGRRTSEYALPKAVCAACPLRPQCIRAILGRTIQRHEHHELLEQARQQSNSHAGRQDRKRRQQLMERSFADAANNHGFKRARWRRLWRQQIQDYLIAAIQNVRILIKTGGRKPGTAAAPAFTVLTSLLQRLRATLWPLPPVRNFLAAGYLTPIGPRK
jgi:transposase/chorismate mutase